MWPTPEFNQPVEIQKVCIELLIVRQYRFLAAPFDVVFCYGNDFENSSVLDLEINLQLQVENKFRCRLKASVKLGS